MPKYYIITTSPENFDIERKTSGFTVQGLKERHKSTVQKWQPGDKIVYYINKIGKFGAIAEIISGYFKDDAKIWSENDEKWPSRAKSRPIIILEKDEFLDVRRYIDILTLIKNKFSPENWGLAFQGSVREISEEDYQFIESEMRKVISRRKISGRNEARIRLKSQLNRFTKCINPENRFLGCMKKLKNRDSETEKA